MNCEKCQIGRYRPTTAPYLRWLGSKIMLIPDVPAHTCDICGDMAYDADFMHRLQLLLDKLISGEPSGQATRQPTNSDGSRADIPPEGVDSLVS
jgi:YgiT-type zinc finger domain-containing protein